jgi:hypothetical protein
MIADMRAVAGIQRQGRVLTDIAIAVDGGGLPA